jgi:hypothetical protein
MSFYLKKHKTDFTTATIERERFGLFFHSPIYKKYFDVYGDEGDYIDLYNPGFVFRLLNPLSRFKSLKKFVTRENAAGFSLNHLRWPFYFKRIERKAFLTFEDYYVVAEGCNYVDARVAGECIREYTYVYFKKKLLCKYRSDVNGGYKNTYAHVLSDSVCVSGD